jgi:hypothetical protein
MLSRYSEDSGVYFGLLKSMVDRGLQREVVLTSQESGLQRQQQQDKDIEQMTKRMFTSEE